MRKYILRYLREKLGYYKLVERISTLESLREKDAKCISQLHNDVDKWKRKARDYQKQMRRLAQHDGGKAAIATLTQMGYRWRGGELWKPPLGARPVSLDEKENDHD